MNELPDDPEKMLTDPMFVSPGSGRYGLTSLEGYRLNPGSPCFDQAVVVETEENIHDFYGNPVVKTPINIGVDQEKRDPETSKMSPPLSPSFKR